MTRAPKTETPISAALETVCDRIRMPANPMVAVRKASISDKTKRMLTETRKTHSEAGFNSAAGSAGPTGYEQAKRIKSP